MSTNTQVAAPRWDYGYFEDLLKNPRQTLPDLNEARPHISLLFCVLHKKHVPEMARVTKIAFPSRPSVPTRNRSEAFEEHEKKCHQMNLDYFTAICNEFEKNGPRFVLTKNKEALGLVATELPRLRALINIVQCIVEPSRAAPIVTAREDPYVPLPSSPSPLTSEQQYTHVPVSALFSLAPEIEEMLKGIPLGGLFTPDTHQNHVYGFTPESQRSVEAEHPGFHRIDKSTNEVLEETAVADDPYSPVSFSSIDSSSSSSSIISSYSLDWKMDLSFDPFAKCDLPRLSEEQNEEPSTLFKFEMNTDGAAFKMSSTVVNANSILEMCLCRKSEDGETKKKSEFVMDQLIKEIPRNMTDEISEILLQISIATEAAKMY